MKMELLGFSKNQTKINFIFKYMLFSTLLLNFSCYKVERNCSNFRFGTFKYERVIGDKLSTSFFIRNNDIEIEYYNNKIDTSKINPLTHPIENTQTLRDDIETKDIEREKLQELSKEKDSGFYLTPKVIE